MLITDIDHYAQNLTTPNPERDCLSDKNPIHYNNSMLNLRDKDQFPICSPCAHLWTQKTKCIVGQTVHWLLVLCKTLSYQSSPQIFIKSNSKWFSTVGQLTIYMEKQPIKRPMWNRCSWAVTNYIFERVPVLVILQTKWWIQQPCRI